MDRVIHAIVLEERSAMSLERRNEYGDALLSLNPGYEFKIVDGTAALHFMNDHFPQYVDLYESMPFDLWKADLVKYLTLYKHGGIVISLDLQPIIGFDSLLARVQSLSVPSTTTIFCIGARPPFERANDFMLAPASDRLFLKLADSLRTIARGSDRSASSVLFSDILALHFLDMRSFAAVNGAFFLQEVLLQGLADDASFSINSLPDESVIVSRT